MPLLLSYLNVSNSSNLLADSGFIFQDCLLAGMRRLGWETVLIGPDGSSPLTTSPVIEVDIPDTKYGVRYNFPWPAIEAALRGRRLRPDALLVNQPELALPLSALVDGHVGRRVPLGVYYHYIPIQDIGTGGQVTFDSSLNDHGLGESIWGRQVEAAHFADILMIGSEWGRETFIRASGDSALRHKMFVVPPPTTVHRSSTAAGTRRPVTFLYNHRLYAHYGTAEIFDWLEELNRRSPGSFRVAVTNPTSHRSLERRRLDHSIDVLLERIAELSFVKIVDVATREAYETLIDQVDIGLSPLRLNALWNMAIVDLMGKGRPVLGYRYGAIPEIVQDPSMLFEDRNDFITKAGSLISSPDLIRSKGEQAMVRSAVWEPQKIARRVDTLFSAVFAAPRA